MIGKGHGWPIAEHKRGEITLLPIEIVPFDEKVFWNAVRFKAEDTISCADAFAAALAMDRGATLLTTDLEFDVLGNLLPRIAV